MFKTRSISAVIFLIYMAVHFAIGFYYVPVLLLLFAEIAVFGSDELVRAFSKDKEKSDGLSVTLMTLQALSFILLCGPINCSIGSSFSWLHPLDAHRSTLPWGQVLLFTVVYLALSGYILMRPLLKKGAEALPRAITQLALGLYISLPLIFGALLFLYFPYGWSWILLAFMTTWISDSAAYLIGSLMGKHKIFPVLSPNKTWEGSIGALVATGLIYILIARFLSLGSMGITVPIAFAAGIFNSFAAQFGDLLESAIKRYLKVKDLGNVLPGHGGFMDRFDSTLTSLVSNFILASAFVLMIA